MKVISRSTFKKNTPHSFSLQRGVSILCTLAKLWKLCAIRKWKKKQHFRIENIYQYRSTWHPIFADCRQKAWPRPIRNKSFSRPTKQAKRFTSTEQLVNAVQSSPMRNISYGTITYLLTVAFVIHAFICMNDIPQISVLTSWLCESSYDMSNFFSRWIPCKKYHI